MAAPVIHWNLDRPAAELPESFSSRAAMVNVTNQCTLKCEHCFVFRDANPNQRTVEPTDDALLDQLKALARKHSIVQMLWMGGEPLLKKALLRRGLPLFEKNTITTNGTLPLADYSDAAPDLLYVVSLDGPEELNDAIRGKGVFRRVLGNLSKLPDDFPHVIQCHCVVTKRNQDALPEFVDTIRNTRFNHMTFSFHVPGKDDHGPDAWASVEDRDRAVRTVMGLKAASDGFVRNRTRSLEMMLSENNPKALTDNCRSEGFVLPLYLDGKTLVTPFCCYGNDIDCDRCGAWMVFDVAARRERGHAARKTRPTPSEVE